MKLSALLPNNMTTVTKKSALRYQPFVGLYGATILLAEPEAEACSIYKRHLQDAHMQVVDCDGLNDLLRQIMAVKPDAVVLNPTPDIGLAIRAVKKIKQEFPKLPVITVSENLQENHLDAIMNTGVSIHLNRQLSRPRDLLVALEQILT